MSEKEKDASELKEEQLNNHIDSAEEATTNTEEPAENVADNKEFGEAEAEDPIEVLQKQVTEEKNKYLRLYAEF